MAADVGEFAGREAAGLVEEAGGEAEFAEVVEQSGGHGVFGVKAELGSGEAGEGGDAAGVGGVGLLAVYMRLGLKNGAHHTPHHPFSRPTPHITDPRSPRRLGTRKSITNREVSES